MSGIVTCNIVTCNLGGGRQDLHTDVSGIATCDLLGAHLVEACRNGRLRLVAELLALTVDHRVDVNGMDDNAFRVACENGHVDVVRHLPALGGDRRVDVHVGGETHTAGRGHACSPIHLQLAQRATSGPLSACLPVCSCCEAAAAEGRGGAALPASSTHAGSALLAGVPVCATTRNYFSALLGLISAFLSSLAPMDSLGGRPNALP